MKNLKKILVLALVAISIMAVALPALAGPATTGATIANGGSAASGSFDMVKDKTTNTRVYKAAGYDHNKFTVNFSGTKRASGSGTVTVELWQSVEGAGSNSWTKVGSSQTISVGTTSYSGSVSWNITAVQYAGGETPVFYIILKNNGTTTVTINYSTFTGYR